MIKPLFITVALFVMSASITMAGDCRKIGSACIDDSPTKVFSGVEIPLAAAGGCWEYEDTYSCGSNEVLGDCQELRDRGCSQIGSSCIDMADNGACALYAQTYQCLAAAPEETTRTSCGNQMYCLDGNCSDASYPPDADFARAVTFMEAQRQAGVYLDPNTLTIFNGSFNSCSKKMGGIGNCCKKNVKGGDSNNLVARTALDNIGTNVGGFLVDQTQTLVGSTYAYDALFQSDAPNWMANGFESMFGSGPLPVESFNPSLSFMGVTATFGGAAPAGATTLLSGQGFTVYFNPATFYLAVAMMVIQELMSCTQDEQVLSLKRGSNLCVFIGSYCASKALGGCVETKESYCCFNSRLARIINEQGRVQLGRGWGSVEEPDCKGFTMDELESIDFAALDLTEFYREVIPSLPDSGKVAGTASTYDISPLKDRVPAYFEK